MNFIWDKITEWLKGLLVSGIISNLSGLFDAINTRVGEAAAVVGTTPQAWHGGIFQMIRSLSENVVVPIAGIILTFIMCLELIQMLIDRNSLHDFDTFLFFKWIFKTFAAVLIVTNTWNIVMAVFDVAQNVVSQASGIIIGDTALDAAALLGDMEQALMAMEIGPLFGLWFQSSLMGILAWVLSICIFIVIYGRMIEIYMVTSIAPIPMATMGNGGRWAATICGRSLRWVFRPSSSWSASRFMRYSCRASAPAATSAPPCGRASATRCCCASRSSKPAASRNPCSMRTDLSSPKQ